MDLYEIDQKFNERIGRFILTFSTVEFQIGTLASYLINGKDANTLDPDVMGLELSKKLKIIRNRIQTDQNLFSRWAKLEGKLSNCNDFRRFISHGIVSNHIPNPYLTGLIRGSRNGESGFRFKKITDEVVKDNIHKIIDINTGRNGLGVLIPEIKSTIS
jgi:hypothetical protein